VVAATPDDPATLARFKLKHALPFRLVSDAAAALARAFGMIPGSRQTVVIGKSGEIEHVYDTVPDPGGHAKQILKDIKTRIRKQKR